MFGGLWNLLSLQIVLQRLWAAATFTIVQNWNVAAAHDQLIEQNLKCLYKIWKCPNKTDYVRTLCLNTFKSLFLALHASNIIWIVAPATIDFSLIQARLPLQSKDGCDTSPCVVECSHIKWVWLQLLAVYDCLFVLKRGIMLARLSFTAG